MALVDTEASVRTPPAARQCCRIWDCLTGFSSRIIIQAEPGFRGFQGAGVQRITLTQGLHALVDDEDYAGLAAYKWYVITGRSGIRYAARHSPRNLGPITISMHRQILKAEPGQQVDHKNHDGLDNRKTNIRICTHAQNMHNRRPKKGGSSVYKGVSWNKARGTWGTMLRVDGINRHLGCFKSEIDAAEAYDNAARKHFGEFACLNFQPTEE